MKCCWEVTRHETEGKGNLHAVQARQADQSTGACVCAGSADGGEYKTITGEEYTA